VSARTWYDWHLVGHGSDPVPVDQWDVDDIADDMRERATKAASIRSTLSKLADLDGWRGETAEEFGDKAGKVLDDLEKVIDRYEDVASALDWWASAVGTARTRTQQAVLDAEDAQRRVESNDIDVASGPDPSQALLDQQSQADTRKSQAQGDLADAQQAMRTAMDALDDAAETAKGKIDDAADNWDDGAWGNVKGVLRKGADFVEFLCAALEVIAAILGAIILVLVLTIGAPFALLVVALALAVAILVGHAFLMMLDEGDVGWDTIGIDVLNVALSMTGLKLLGPAVSGGLRSLQAAVPGIAARAGSASRMAAISRLASGQTRLYENALRFANPAGRLGQWAQGIRRTADIADVTETQRVLALLNRQPGTLSTLMRQDRELAQLNHLVRSMQSLGHHLDPIQVGQLRHLNQLVQAGTLANVTSSGILTVKDLPDVPENLQTMVDYIRDHPIEPVSTGAGTGLRPVP
jgi:uncharacterized protein YukE